MRNECDHVWDCKELRCVVCNRSVASVGFMEGVVEGLWMLGGAIVPFLAGVMVGFSMAAAVYKTV